MNITETTLSTIGPTAERIAALDAAINFMLTASRILEEKSWSDEIGQTEKFDLIHQAQAKLNRAAQYQNERLEIINSVSKSLSRYPGKSTIYSIADAYCRRISSQVKE